MAVFSRYSAVLEPDGSKMTVRSALARINEILDQVLNEQEGDFDATTRFAIAWYRQHGYNPGAFGEADNLARARNTSVATMDRDEILISRAGKVHLIRPADLDWDYDVLADDHTSAWEALQHTDPGAGARRHRAGWLTFSPTRVSRPDGAVELDLVKELAFLLFSLAEKNGWTKDAISFNGLVTSWPDVLDAMKRAESAGLRTEQDAFTFDDGDELDMALSNRDRIGQLFDIVSEPLQQFVAATLDPELTTGRSWTDVIRAVEGNNGKDVNPADPAETLKLISQNYTHRFQPVVGLRSARC